LEGAPKHVGEGFYYSNCTSLKTLAYRFLESNGMFEGTKYIIEQLKDNSKPWCLLIFRQRGENFNRIFCSFVNKRTKRRLSYTAALLSTTNIPQLLPSPLSTQKDVNELLWCISNFGVIKEFNGKESGWKLT
jgi:hypothetical protein